MLSAQHRGVMDVLQAARTLFLAFLLMYTAKFTLSLRLTNMTAPPIADPRDGMQLDCHFDMGAEVLYAVKWYKDDQEFFRYMPHQEPHKLNFPVVGVITQATSCGENWCKVHLNNLTRKHSGGAYRCEVSSEAPAFRLASETHNVTVAAVPREGPRMTGLADTYGLGDPLTALCTSAPADPVPQLTWYINNLEVRPEALGETSSSTPDKHGLASRSSSLRLARIETRHIQDSVLRLRCESSLPRIPVQPQNVAQTIIIRTQPSQVSNEMLQSVATHPARPQDVVLVVLFSLLAGVP